MSFVSLLKIPLMLRLSDALASVRRGVMFNVPAVLIAVTAEVSSRSKINSSEGRLICFEV